MVNKTNGRKVAFKTDGLGRKIIGGKGGLSGAAKFAIEHGIEYKIKTDPTGGQYGVYVMPAEGTGRSGIRKEIEPYAYRKKFGEFPLTYRTPTKEITSIKKMSRKELIGISPISKRKRKREEVLIKSKGIRFGFGESLLFGGIKRR